MEQLHDYKIDFVITWVDGNDPKWIAEKNKWESLACGKLSLYGDANSDCRYRSDDVTIKYWFRAVEKYTPWVNKVHFVTCGQKPYWLNESHPKLNLVNHEEYIPSCFLPTYNASCINMNLHRIGNLTEHFVLFDDDVFVLRPLAPNFFFKEGVPVLITDLRYESQVGYNNWSRTLFNDQCVVNRSFNIKRQIWNNRRKWFNIKELGVKRVRQNAVCYLANKVLPVHLFGHLSSPNLKSTMCEVWDKWPDVMECTCKNKFRGDDRVNVWLLLAWNQAKGSFFPVHEKRMGKNYSISPNNVEEVCNAIRNQTIPQICINDTINNTNNDYCMRMIAEAFDTILPDKSSFEK